MKQITQLSSEGESPTLMTKKFINKNVFLCHNKNLNWEVLAENLITFWRWDVVKYEKF